MRVLLRVLTGVLRTPVWIVHRPVDASVVLAGLSTWPGLFITPGTGLQGVREGRSPSFFLVEAAGQRYIARG
jgi:hypothetical protein